MATSEKPVETEPEVEEIDATEEEWEDEEDPTVGESIVPYEGGIVPRAQWDLKAVFQGFEGVALWTHDGKPALYYEVPNRGTGLSVRAMRILSAMRGGFDECELEVEKAECYEAVIGPDGKPVIESVPAIKATVRIRDLLAGNVRIGTWSEPVAKLRNDKRGYFVVPNPAMVAISKAKRNAYAEHFAPVVEPLLKAIKEECQQKRAFLSGQVPGWVLSGLPEDEPGEERVPSSVDRRQARAEAVIGNSGRDEVLARLLPLEATLGPGVREEFVAWGVATFGTSKVATWPARRRGEIEAWFAEKAVHLKAKLDAEPDGADPFADSNGGALDHIPTPQDVRALLAATDRKLVERAYELARMRDTNPLDDPDSCAKLWQALHEVRAKAEEAPDA